VKRVGLTGNIASGKSTVARLLRQRHGAAVIDADQVARDLVAPGSALLRAVVQRFGDDILRPDGSLDRGALGALVVDDLGSRQDLEALIHPAIRAHIHGWLREQEQAGRPVAVVEASLLVETGSARDYDLLLVVSCSPQTQLQRLGAHRGFSAERARSWLATQLPAAEKERLADIVVHNDGSPEQLRTAVDSAWAAISGESVHAE